MDLGRSFGLKNKQVHQCIQDSLAATSTYAERVMALERVPLQQRRQLVEIVQRERRLLQGGTNAVVPPASRSITPVDGKSV